MKLIVAWSLVREETRPNHWEHILICTTSEQEVIRFGNHKPFLTLDSNLIATDFGGETYQFDRAGFAPIGERPMGLDTTISWIKQYWTFGFNDLFSYIGHDSSVDGDCQEFYHVVLKRLMGKYEVGTSFSMASLSVSHKGILVTFSNYSPDDVTFLVEWGAIKITPL